MAAFNTKGLRVSMVNPTVAGTVEAVTGATNTRPIVVDGTFTAVTGDLVVITGTGWSELDGKQFVVGAATGTTLELLGSDGTLKAAAVAAGTWTTANATWWNFVTDVTFVNTITTCFSSLTINKEAAGTIDVGTFCSPVATIAGIQTTAGTVSFEGYVDVADAGYQALVDAEADQLDRLFQVALPSAQGYILFEGPVTLVNQGMTIDGAITYNGSITMKTLARHAF